MSEQRVRLGSLGLGWWGSELAGAAGRTGRAEIVSCFARSEQGRLEFADRYDCRSAGSLDEFLTDPEIEGVLIATPHQSHRELIGRAAAAGKHVFVDKPLTTTVADGRASVAAARDGGVLLQVGHQRRRMAANRRIKLMLESGEMGDVGTVVAQSSIPNGFRMAAGAWRWDPKESPLGSMTSLGIHMIDTMHYFVGPIRAVSAFSRAGRSHPIDEATILACVFESGAVGTLTTSFFTPRVNTISVFGTESAAYSAGGGSELKVQATGDSGLNDVELEPIDAVADQLAEFASAIRGEAQIETDGEVGLAAIAVLAAAVESVATGRSVDVR
ncbi:MAG: Gfo/Idh/MocA family protein [Acidimicrobiia bacterium]